MQWLILLFMSLTLSGEVLILKNGKKMLADSVQRENGTVTIKRKGQSFALPETVIDWDASAKATAQFHAQLSSDRATQKKAAEAKRQAEEDQYKLKQNAELTNKNYQRRGNAATRGGKTELNYRLQGNNIIVALTINGQGPFDIVLDTGASKTVIDPALLNQVGGKRTGKTVPMTGVAGKVLHSPIYMMDELSLSGARVSTISVLGNRINALSMFNIHGLLGQDFLNHFVVNINTATKIITLDPHNLHDNKGQVAELDPEKFSHSLTAFFRDLDGITKVTLQQVDTAVRANQTNRQNLQSTRSTINRLQRESGSLFGQLGKFEDHSLTPEAKKSVQQLRTCQPRLNRIFRGLDAVQAALSRGRDLKSKDKAGDYKRDLVDKANELRGFFNEFKQCL